MLVNQFGRLTNPNISNQIANLPIKSSNLSRVCHILSPCKGTQGSHSAPPQAPQAPHLQALHVARGIEAQGLLGSPHCSLGLPYVLHRGTVVGSMVKPFMELPWCPVENWRRMSSPDFLHTFELGITNCITVWSIWSIRVGCPICMDSIRTSPLCLWRRRSKELRRGYVGARPTPCLHILHGYCTLTPDGNITSNSTRSTDHGVESHSQRFKFVSKRDQHSPVFTLFLAGVYCWYCIYCSGFRRASMGTVYGYASCAAFQLPKLSSLRVSACS